MRWGEQALYVALDTSMLWNTYCLIRLSVIYRGRAVPLVWCVLQHGSAQVAFTVYQDLLERAALLLPRRCKVIFLADCGFADTELMAQLQRLGWHWRIRIKRSFWLYRRGRPRCKVERLACGSGASLFLAAGVHHRQAVWPRISGGGSKLARARRVVCSE